MSQKENKCNLCGKHGADQKCDHCGLKNMCSLCYVDDVSECLCRDCIMNTRDCGFCQDMFWHKPGKQELVIVCPVCHKGYCDDCAFKADGSYYCPQCFENLGDCDPNEQSLEQFIKTHLAADEKIREAERESLKMEKQRLDNERKQQLEDIINAEKSVTRSTTVQASAQTPVVPPAPPASPATLIPAAPPAPPAVSVVLAPAPQVPARRRRQPPSNSSPEERLLESMFSSVKVEKVVTIPPKKTKREDNVLIEDDDNFKKFKYAMTYSGPVMTAQVCNRLRTRYGFLNPQALIDDIKATKSAILGSFNLEVTLGDSYDDSDLDIYGSSDGLEHVKRHLPPEYRLTIAQDNKYQNMVDCHFIKHVDTYETPLRRIQFVVMTDLRKLDDHVALSDMTIVQNKFDGQTMYIGHVDTLAKKGTVFKYYEPRVLRYFERNFALQITLTGDIAQKLFTK